MSDSKTQTNDSVTLTLEGEELERIKTLVTRHVTDVGWNQAYIDFMACTQLMEWSAKK